MKSFRKRLLTLLALTLFGGAGAWAQGPTQVTQFTTDLIADWQGVNENVTLADLQALGFGATDYATAAAWTGAPQGEYSWLIYGFDAGNCNYIMFDDSGDPGSPSHTSYTKSYFYNRVSNGNKYFYTGAPNPGAGASAQGPTTVFEVDFSSNHPTATTGSMRFGNGMSTSSVYINNNVKKIYTIQIGVQYDYSDNRYVSIKPATGSFKKGDTLLIAVCYNNYTTKTAQADIYAANGTTKLFTTAPGINGYTESGDPVVEKFVLEQDADSLLFGGSSSSNDHTYVTTLKVLRPAVIELTKTGANQWTLGQTPDYDLELQVEYYQKYALKDIPAGWTVMVNGVDKTSAIVGDSLMITETDSVTLIPPADVKPNVKSVTLEDEAPAVQTITVDGLQLNYVEGENWVQTAQRNPDVLTTDSYYVFKKNSTIVLLAGEQTVSPTSTYDPSLNYYWEAW